MKQVKLAAAFVATLVAIPAFGKTIAITGATLVNSNGDLPLRDAVVVVKNQRILAAGKAGAIRIPRDAERIDAAGKWVIPGLIDGHMHFFQSGGLYTRPDALDLRAFTPYEADRERIRAGLDNLFARYLRCGITSLADMGGPFWNFDVRERARTSAIAPRVAVAGPLISTASREVLGTVDPPIIQAKTPEDAIALVRREAERKPDFIKIWYLVGPGETAAQHLPMVSAATAEAHRLGLRVAVHATELDTAKAALRAGADILVHSVEDADVDEEFIQLLLKQKAIYLPTLVVIEGYREAFTQEISVTTEELRRADPRALGSVFDLRHLPSVLPPAAVDYIRQKFGSLPAVQGRNLKRVHDAGVTVAAGTDAGNIGTHHGPAMYRELEMMVQAGLSPQQVLITATRNGARLMGLANDLGVIEKGRLADLVILDADPLADIRNVARVNAVMKAGVLFSLGALERETSADVVQRQVNAYNAGNIDAFAEAYDPDVEIYDYPSTLILSGAQKLRDVYGSLFASAPKLHVEIRNRMTTGAYVIDEEHATGTPDGRAISAIAIYEVRDHLIRKVWLITGGAPE